MAEEIETPGGYQAVQLRVAEQYVEELGLLAKDNNTMIVPANVGDVSPIIVTAMSVIKQTRGPQDAGQQPRARTALPATARCCARVRTGSPFRRAPRSSRHSDRRHRSDDRPRVLCHRFDRFLPDLAPALPDLGPLVIFERAPRRLVDHRPGPPQCVCWFLACSSTQVSPTGA